MATGHHPKLRHLENQLFQFCADYAKSPGNGRRLLVHGTNGVGKSHSARAIFHWASRVSINLPLVATDDGMSLPRADFIHWPTVIKRLKPPYEEVWRIDDVENSSLLVVDDIGAEYVPTDKDGVPTSGFSNEKLYLLLERREWRWTILTTNVKPEQWEDRFERRISSRFLRNCECIDLEGVPDYKSI